jgi:hypothetical protein
MLALGAASALPAANSSSANRREFQLGPDSIKLFDPGAPSTDSKPDPASPGVPAPANGTPAAQAGGTSGSASQAKPAILPPILVAPATPLPPPPVSDRRNFSSPDGGLLLNLKAVRIGSDNAPAPVPGSRREFKVGGP